MRRPPGPGRLLVTAVILRLPPALADALDGLLGLAESVNEHLDDGQAALGEILSRARRDAPPPDSPAGQLQALLDAHAGDDSAWWVSFRNCVIGLPADNDTGDMAAAEAVRICGLIAAIAADRCGGREELTRLALSLSLCPLHLTDYASCFDDQNPGCAAIRLIHPDHDS
jgi:hypothetical protein